MTKNRDVCVTSNVQSVKLKSYVVNIRLKRGHYCVFTFTTLGQDGSSDSQTHTFLIEASQTLCVGPGQPRQPCRGRWGRIRATAPGGPSTANIYFPDLCGETLAITGRLNSIPSSRAGAEGWGRGTRAVIGLCVCLLLSHCATVVARKRRKGARSLNPHHEPGSLPSLNVNSNTSTPRRLGGHWRSRRLSLLSFISGFSCCH